MTRCQMHPCRNILKSLGQHLSSHLSTPHFSTSHLSHLLEFAATHGPAAEGHGRGAAYPRRRSGGPRSGGGRHGCGAGRASPAPALLAAAHPPARSRRLPQLPSPTTGLTSTRRPRAQKPSAIADGSLTRHGFPRGFRFVPTELELIHLLSHRIHCGKLPPPFDRIFHNLRILDYHPEELYGISLTPSLPPPNPLLI